MTWTYDVLDPTTASGSDDGTMTIVGSGELTQIQMNAAVDAYYNSNSVKLTKLLIGPLFESVGVSAISGTGLESIRFDPNSNITTIDRKGLSNNIALTELVLPSSLAHVSTLMCAGCVSLVTLTIPDSVKTIGYRAFYDCSALTAFSLPAKVTTVVDNAFEGCHALLTTDFAPVNSELITLGDAAFKDCSSLETMIFPESLVELGNSTFVGCVALKVMTFSTTFQSLGNETFRGCTALRSVVFPESLIIGTGTFLEATGVVTLRMHRDIWDLVVTTLPTAVERQLVTFYNDEDYVYSRTLDIQRDPWAYDQVGGVVSSRVYDGTMTLLGPGELTQSQVNAAINEHTYQHGTNNVLHTLLIGEFIESLGASAISGTTTVKSILFGSTGKVTSIGQEGLSTNVSLTEVVLPLVLTALGNAAFKDCTSLQTLVFPDSLAVLGDSTFMGCTSLQTLGFTDYLITLGDSTFMGCTSLQTLILPLVLTTLGHTTFKDCTSLQTLVFPNSLTVLGDSTFAGCASLENITFSTTFQSFGQETFRGCKALNTVSLPESLVVLGDSTFVDCVALENITFSTTLQSLGKETFRGCTALKTVVFPENPTIGTGTFLEATNVVTLRLHRDIWDLVVATLPIAAERQLVTFYNDLDYIYSRTLVIQRDHWAYDQVKGVVSRVYDGTLTLLGPGELTQSQTNAAIDEHTYQHGTTLKLHTLHIGEFIESLGASAISGTRLRSVLFDPNSNVTTIDRKGLSINLVLTELVLPSGLTHISTLMCAGCVSLTTLTIPTNVKTIGYRAFYECSALTSFALPAKVTTVVDNAFESCHALRETEFSPLNSKLITLGDAAFKDCTDLQVMIFPESLTALGDSTFMDCVAFNTITFSTTLQSLGNETFRGCTALGTVTCPESLVVLGNSTFVGCSALEYITFSTALKSLGRETFRGCTALGTVHFPESLHTSIGAGTFLETTKVVTLKMHRDIWDVVVATLPIAAERQLVTFYNILDVVFLRTLAIQRDRWAYDQVNDVVSQPYDGTLTFLGHGELIQSEVNAAIEEHTYQYGVENVLHTLLIGELIDSLGAFAISSTTTVKSILFGNNSKVTSIGQEGLSNNVALTEVGLPFVLTTLGDGAVKDCTSLKNLVFPENLVTLGDSTFVRCVALENITFSKMLQSFRHETFAGCTALETVVFPESLVTLGDSTFDGCVALKNITFSTALQSLGNETFRGCKSLGTIVFPESLVAAIGVGTFLETKNVVTLKMHRDIWDLVVATLPIGAERQLVTFYKDLDYIYSRTLVIQRDHWAYDQVKGVVSRVYDGTLTLLGPGELTQSQTNAAIDEHTYQHGSTLKLHTLHIGEFIESLGASAISGTRLRSILFDANSKITTIERKGLSLNLTLTDLVLPPSLAHISTMMCAGCKSLATITIPDNVKTIGYRAFYDCSALTSFALPAKVTTVVDNAFEGCHALKTIDFAPLGSELVTLGDAAFKDCVNLETIIFPESLVTLGDLVFEGATNINSVTLNQNLWSDSLLPPNINGSTQTVSYSSDPTIVYSAKNGVLTVGTGLVYDVVNSTMTGTYDGRPLRVVGTGELTQTQLALVLDAYAADNGSRLITIDLDKGIVALGAGAFANVTTLSSIFFPADSALLTIGPSAFQGCTALSQITIPAGVTTIGDLAFDRSTSLQNVDFAPLSQLTSLGSTIFKDCSSLQTIELPESLVALQDSTFLNCTALTTLGFPQSLIDLGKETFGGCTALKDVIFSTALKSLGQETFRDCTVLTEMFFPESLSSLGSATFQNCTSLQKVVFPRSTLLTIEGTTTFAGATAIETLQMHETLWETAIQASMVKNVNILSQLVQFYSDPDILQSLETQKTFWTTTDGFGSANAEGYQHIVDYYATSDNYTIDYSNGITTLVKAGGTTGLIYDVGTNVLSGLGTYDGALTIVGSGGELSQNFVNIAIAAHSGAQKGVVPLRTLTVGPTFTSLGTLLSLQGTGITKLMFPAESPITTTGTFGLVIDSTLTKTVVLPRWVVQQGPWSLV
jgi:hypothetical protein